MAKTLKSQILTHHRGAEHHTCRKELSGVRIDDCEHLNMVATPRIRIHFAEVKLHDLGEVQNSITKEHDD